MNIRRLAASALTFLIAAGALTVSPINSLMETGGFALTASAAEADNGDFVIKNDYYRGKALEGYKGKGGKITLPEGISAISKEAFKGNSSITEIVIPSGVENVYKSAFEGCTKLKKVTFKGDVKCVDQYAFSNCSKLTSVVFEGDVQKISQYAFSRCTALENVTFKGDIASPATDESAICGGIWDSAFSDCYNLKSVNFAPDTKVDTIGRNAFRSCFKLKSVNFPSGLGEIGMDAFCNCSALENIAIPAGTKLSPRSIGHAYNSDNAKNKYFVADGKTKGKDMVYTAGSDTAKASVFTPKAVTLAVAKGSPAEKYAVKNGIKYEYLQNGLASPTGFSASISSDKITLKWFGVNDAELYYIYMYNPKTGLYEKCGSSKITEYTIKGLEPNTKYKFKVSAAKKTDGKYKTGTKSQSVSFSTKKA